MLCGFISLIVQTPQYKLIYHIKTTKTTQNVRLPQLMYYYHIKCTYTSTFAILPHYKYVYLTYYTITTYINRQHAKKGLVVSTEIVASGFFGPRARGLQLYNTSHFQSCSAILSHLSTNIQKVSTVIPFPLLIFNDSFPLYSQDVETHPRGAIRGYSSLFRRRYRGPFERFLRHEKDWSVGTSLSLKFSLGRKHSFSCINRSFRQCQCPSREGAMYTRWGFFNTCINKCPYASLLTSLPSYRELKSLRSLSPTCLLLAWACHLVRPRTTLISHSYDIT